MKVLKYIAYIIVFATVLCFYSWMIFHVSTGGQALNGIKKPLIKFASFPQKVEEIFNSPEVNNIPVTYTPIEPNFTPINELNYDLFGLTSFWNDAEKQWDIKMINFKNDSVLYQWQFAKKDYDPYYIHFANSPPRHMLLLPNKEVVGRLSMSPHLFRIDSNSNFIWLNKELEYHHSLNLDAAGNIWVVASDVYKEKSDIQKYTGGLVKNLDGQLISYREDYLVNIDIQTGEILFKKGIGKILLENDQKGILYGADIYDPSHVNDIQPALSDTKFWKKDDLFVSLRSRSLLLIYRPSTNRIIKIIQGPFISQHDVDILSDHEISIFNNNYISYPGKIYEIPYMDMDSLNSSQVVVYDFEADSFHVLNQKIFEKYKIRTYYQGLSQILRNGDIFVEEHHSGEYYIVNDTGVVLIKVFETPLEGYVHYPNWIRLYEDRPF